MSETRLDLVIIGAGSGGLTAAGFAARLGAKIALVEKTRIGGDCTWTGCVPSKALLKAAKVAHEVRTAAHYGIVSSTPVTEMSRVREYVRGAIQQVYRAERPEELASRGIEVVMGGARFLDSHTIQAGEKRLSAKSFLITTGARPVIPAVGGLAGVPYLTYEEIFDNESLPRRLIVVGAGPVGAEIAQAYQRFGAQVTVIGPTLLPKEEPDARAVMEKVFESEGIRFIRGRADAAKVTAAGLSVSSGSQEAEGDLLLIASGRQPAVAGLDLQKAGVSHSEKGIAVDDQLRTNVAHIYAAGDVTGGYQFTHFAGWQAFQAVRNALLPGSRAGHTDLAPWVTFTDPEVAHLGLTELQANEKFGGGIEVRRWDLTRCDRAVCENDGNGFVKVILTKEGGILGATIVAARAGELISEFAVAMQRGMKMADLAGAIHPYPTYSTMVQQMAADGAVDATLSGVKGGIIRALSKFHR